MSERTYEIKQEEKDYVNKKEIRRYPKIKKDLVEEVVEEALS